jgi:hypothetical protein
VQLAAQNESQFPIEGDCLVVRAEDVQKRYLGSSANRCHKRPDEHRREALPSVRGVHAKGADLREPIHPHVLAHHRNQHTATPHTKILAQVNCSRAEWPLLCCASKRQHLRDMRPAEYFDSDSRWRTASLRVGEDHLVDFLSARYREWRWRLDLDRREKREPAITWPHQGHEGLKRLRIEIDGRRKRRYGARVAAGTASAFRKRPPAQW